MRVCVCRACRHIELLLQEHPRTVDLAGSSVRVGRLEILEMTPSEGGPPMPGLPATGECIRSYACFAAGPGRVCRVHAASIGCVPWFDGRCMTIVLMRLGQGRTFLW